MSTNIIIANGSEGALATEVTEKVEFVGRDGVDGFNQNLLPYAQISDLGDLAFDDLVQLAMLGETLVVGGYIKTQVIDVNAIRISGGLATTADVQENSYVIEALRDSLGEMAFKDAISLAMLDNTIIVGGYIKTVLIDVQTLRVDGDLATNAQVNSRIIDAIENISFDPSQLGLGQLAFLDLVDLSKFDETIIVGGYIKTSLLDVNAIRVSGSLVTNAQADAKILAAISAIDPGEIGDLGDLAFQDLVSAALLDTTIIVGGYIKTSLLDVNAIRISGSLVTTTEIDSAINAAIADLEIDPATLGLGDLAMLDLVSAAILDTTIIVGGYIKTSLINVSAIKVAGSLIDTGQLNSAVATAIADFEVDVDSLGLGNLALLDLVSASVLDSTLIVGGYIKTSLINTSALVISGYTTSLDFNNLLTSLGSFAFASTVPAGAVGLASLDSTVVVGGYIKTSLLDAAYIKANIINAGYINALDITVNKITANEGTIGGWQITGNGLVDTSSGGKTFVSNTPNFAGGTYSITYADLISPSVYGYAPWAGLTVHLSYKNPAVYGGPAPYKTVIIELDGSGEGYLGFSALGGFEATVNLVSGGTLAAVGLSSTGFYPYGSTDFYLETRVAGRFESTAIKNGFNVGLVVNAEGAIGNIAIDVKNGAVVLRNSASLTLEAAGSNIYVFDGSTMKTGITNVLHTPSTITVVKGIVVGAT